MEGVDTQAFKEVDEKGFVPDDVRNGFFRKLRMQQANRSCFECSARNPTWISLSYGVYLCLECSGEHRRKGVHISFVRSVELDRFSPDQMVQMAMGGNAKAWNHFKAHGMGKTSDAGRPVDYNSQISKKYKQQLEKDSKDYCAKMDVACKAPAQVPAKADPIDEFADLAGPPSPSVLQTFKSAPAVVQQPPAPAQAKAAAAAPTSVVVRRAAPAAPESAPAASPAPKPAGFHAGSKQMAKEIDFDFDFDDLENEASKPKPAPPPKAAAPAPAPAPSVTKPAAAAMTVPPPHAHSAGEVDAKSKFAKSKAISSDDFFNEIEAESAQARRDREERYNRFGSSAAISSSSFFGDGNDDVRVGENGDWKAAASDYARAGISKGAEMLTTYLNRGRD